MRVSNLDRARCLVVSAVVFVSILAISLVTAGAARAADRTPPTLTVTQPAQGATVPTGVVTVAFTATDASGIRSVTCKLNTELFASSCTSPKKYTIKKAGSYSVTVIATDRAFNQTKVVRSFKVAVPDTTAPIVTISSPTAGATIAQSSVTASFTATDPGTPSSGVASTRCRLVGPSGQVVFDAACASPAAFNGLTDGAYSLSVYATDAAGNTGSSAVAFTVAIPDTTAPTVTITSPTMGQVFTTNTVTSEFTASDQGTPSSGVVSTNCRLVESSGTVVSDATCESPTVFSSLAVGEYNLTVEAIDGAGNQGSSSVAFSISAPVADTLAPAIEISAPLANESVELTDGTLTASFSVEDVAPPGGTPSGVASVTCWMNGAVSFGQAACSSPKTFTGVVPGSYVFVVRATDNAGNSTYLDRRFTTRICDGCVDLRITYPSANGQSITHTNNPGYQFVANDSNGQAMPTQCALTAGTATATSFSPCTSPWTAGARANGSYTLTVRATHSSGSVHTVTRNFSIAVSEDTSPPMVQITGATVVGTTLSVSWVAIDDIGIADTICTMSAPGYVFMDRFGCTSPTVYSNMPRGVPITFRVLAADAAGNVGSAQYSTVIP